MLDFSGIYVIRHSISGKSYIGSAVKINSRWGVHLTQLRRNMHYNCKLQRSWTKHGEKAFSFDVIEYCLKNELIQREQIWIDTLQPWFNIHPIAGSALGAKRSEAFKRFISEKQSQISADPEERKRRSERARRQHREGRLGAATRTDIQPMKVLHCVECGEQFKQRSSHRQIFCSVLCSNRFKGKQCLGIKRNPETIETEAWVKRREKKRMKYERARTGEGSPKQRYNGE